MYINNPEKFVKENPIDKLNLEKAKEIYHKLVEDLNHHNFLYYVKSQPIISDYEYDILFDYLKKLEEKFPSLISKDSPSQRLTNQIQSELKKAKHKYPLLSLENTYNPDEVEEKIEKIIKEVEKYYKIPDNKNLTDGNKEKIYPNSIQKSIPILFYTEPKYDGLSIELVYKDSYFQQAITRGDGFIGEDVTENVKTINSLPLKINYTGELHIRGEVVVRKSIFEKINKEREKKGLETYSNPRNLASGSLRQLDPSITAKRKLDVICYEILNIEEVGRSSEEIGRKVSSDFSQDSSDFLMYHHEALDFLEKLGFLVYDFKYIANKNVVTPTEELESSQSKNKNMNSIKQVQDNRQNNKISSNSISKTIPILNKFNPRRGLAKEEVLEVVKSEEIKKILDEQDIEFDGLVIKVDNIKYWKILGSTEHHPKRAFAFKYPAKQISSKILDVQLSVGRTGIITPVAILEPVNIDGVIVKRASLHNFDFIKEKDIHIGDYVWVQRSGEVIPYIVGVIKERRKKLLNGNKSHTESNSTHPKQILKEFLKQVQNNLVQDDKQLNQSPESPKNPKIPYENSYLEYLLKHKELLTPDLIENGLIKIIEPPYCPVCDGETFHPQGEVALRCINISCPAQIKERITYFVSKNGLDIQGLSGKTIETLLEAGLIKDYADIFTLPEKRQELLALPGFKEKKVENIIKAIEEKKEIPLNVFLQALGIEFVGKKTAKLITEEVGREIRRGQKRLKDILNGNYIDFEKFIEFLTSPEGEKFLSSINGIGPKVIESIKKFFHEKHNQKVIKKLLKYIKIKIQLPKQGKFSGKSFVVTGSIPGIGRDEIGKWIEENGGEFSNQVTQNTSLLLIGEKPGNSKIKKAQKYNVPSYDLEKFLKENNFDIQSNQIKQESLFA